MKLNYWRILMLDEHGKTIGYYRERYYLCRCLAERRARILAKHYRYRQFYIEAGR